VRVASNESGDDEAEETVGVIGKVIEIRLIEKHIFYGLEAVDKDLGEYYFMEEELEEIKEE
jgi:hypothetical protein